MATTPSTNMAGYQIARFIDAPPDALPWTRVAESVPRVRGVRGRRFSQALTAAGPAYTGLS